MNSFLFALLILALSAVATGILALFSSSKTHTDLANTIGPLGVSAGCLLGLIAVLSGSWIEVVFVSLPWGLPVGSGTLGLDPLSRLFLLPVFGLGLVCALSGRIALRHTEPEEHNLGAHWFFYTMLVLGMALVMTARDLVLFLVAWEIMSIAPFFLIDFNDKDQAVRDASWIYLVAAHLGVVFLIAFFVLLWQQAGGTSFALLSALPHSSLTTGLFILSVLGFGAKAGLAPLHVWLPEAHPAAPSHVSALLSGAMINAGLYGVIRSLDFLGPMDAMPSWWGWTLLYMGVVTGLMGILKAMAQNHLKRMLAYSSVENMGVMFMGVGAGLIGVCYGNAWIAVLGFGGALFHMLNHAAFKGLLFLCAGEILHAVGTVRMEQLGGLQKKMPLVGIAFALGAASIACLPPFNGFCGELVLALSLVKAPMLMGGECQIGLLTALVGLALISGLAMATFAKAYGITFLGEPRTGFVESAHAPSWRDLYPLAIPVTACVLGGVGAPYVFALVAPTALSIADLPVSLLPSAQESVLTASSTLGTVALVGAGGIGLTILLVFFRRMLLGNTAQRQRGEVRESATWGCGYQYGTARIQYTDRSFSEPTTKVFASAMGMKAVRHPDTRYFPSDDTLSLSAPDRLKSCVFTPLFEGVERFFNVLKIVQHGRIHLYILHILATVVVLLIWGLNV